MFANWKSAVYEYAYRRNQLEMDGDLEQLLPIVRDDRYLQRLGHRMRRLGMSRKNRSVSPLRAEIGLKLRVLDESDQQAVVELEIRHALDYEQASNSFREDRLERERVTLSKRKGSWLITSIEPEIPEKKRAAAPQPPFVPEYDPEGRSPSTRSSPYFSERVYATAAYTAAYRAAYYDRAKAQQYAETWWNGYNPKYEQFEVDCTSFVSQCLFAGGAPMNYTGKRESGWWYQGRQGGAERWSFSWAVAHSLQLFLASSRSGLQAEVVDSPRELSIGDVICYDWDGNGRYQHNTIVTGFDAYGMPLVNAHTVNSRARYWDYRDSHAWTPNTRYRFFHISDYFS